MTLKAIQTEYAGHKFRSRLEARWAVFFNTVNIGWTYEAEGYELEYKNQIVHYLPDFKTEYGYFEVKGPEPAKEEYFKMEALAFNSGESVVLLRDIPDQGGAHAPLDMCVKCEDGSTWLPDHDIIRDIGFKLYEAGLDAARKARFEHGEKG